jgi:antitoxin (DNA-binding transcriptional repressor) of toxin-antitoxin stability system
MIDLARAEPVIIEKHGRPVVVVVAIEEWDKLHPETGPATASSGREQE